MSVSVRNVFDNLVLVRADAEGIERVFWHGCHVRDFNVGEAVIWRAAPLGALAVEMPRMKDDDERIGFATAAVVADQPEALSAYRAAYPAARNPRYDTVEGGGALVALCRPGGADYFAAAGVVRVTAVPALALGA